jgi:hypothetical protein
MSKELSTKNREAVAIFKTEKVVDTLTGLMDKVTKSKCDPQTVQAACNCASAITELMKVHVDIEKIRIVKESH